jgi:hypothetical protein
MGIPADSVDNPSTSRFLCKHGLDTDLVTCEQCRNEQRTSNQRLYVCPDCKNQFVQPFTCITCGAQRLYDETVRQQGRQIEAQAAEIERLRAALERIAANNHMTSPHPVGPAMSAGVSQGLAWNARLAREALDGVRQDETKAEQP